MYPALILLMRTPRLPVADSTDAPADLNGLVRLTERRELVSAPAPSHFRRSLLHCPFKLTSLWVLAYIITGRISNKTVISNSARHSGQFLCLLTYYTEMSRMLSPLILPPVNMLSYPELPHILESNPHPNVIRIRFCRFRKRKKKS